MSRVPLKPADFAVGQPLRWDIYDRDGSLVVARGTVIGSEAEKADLLKRRGVRELDLRLDVPAADGPSTESRREVRVLLEEVHIQPGATMQIQSSLDSSRYAVRLIGYLKGKSVTVTNPVQDGASLYLKDGQAFVARIFSGKYVFAFPCSILASAMRPYPYLHLSYPPEVLGIHIRQGERARLRTITAFETDAGRKGSGIIVDISAGGCYFQSKSPDLLKGARLNLKFKLLIGTVDYVLDLPGYVRSMRPSDDAPELGPGFGIQFVDVSPEDNLVLSSFVFQQIAGNQVT
jgi:c-di-GMP-binding flagellar brake protein YcgR